MKFQYSCIGDNTPENREHLEKIGVTHNTLDDELEKNEWLISNYGMYLSIPSFPKELIGASYPHEINCIGNPALFQAVSAVREDSDYLQWFIDEYEMSYQDAISGKWKKTKWFRWNSKDRRCLSGKKTTLDELKEHFK